MLPVLSKLVSWLSEEYSPELAGIIVDWVMRHPEYKTTFEYFAIQYEPYSAVYFITEIIMQWEQFVRLGYY